MADEEADEGPVVELGEGEAIEGAPLARVASRLTWPQEKEIVRRKEGESVIRTPGGPRTLTDVLDEVDETYFDTRQRFVDSVREVIGTGPIPPADA
ncbi:MAG: DUF5789 family protein [Salinigranum sp.]